ncbi:Protein-glutamate methylesterase/protein-glutamine glutaminase [Neolewinella maritima]|uniref:Protein-glutamate methylesterase/protein-glutamine glutaminase n=1 Tax=Neolewinella maritima TaxID=1383882 RepID=A0ABN8F0D3_9BACT|nr:chemotaxis protein CheB [Neolewinella maritima]CAH0999774.1 Protein-glutamate methylesterase/protein-glutamine glutaminase [Neolewinella maritima]
MAVRIVGIGASAGGLQALETFFSELPTGLGVAYVVVQHLSPDHVSNMDSILQRATALKVRSLDEDTVPQADHVYVKRPEYEVRVGDQLTLLPRQSGNDALYLPIDDFFFSLAQSRREDAIGIILSGMGTDGSRGLKEIKAQGGLVMVQTPRSAQFDGMPSAALRQHIADVVLPPSELASRLAMMLRHNSVQPPSPGIDLTDQDNIYRVLLERVHATTRIDFTRYRPATIHRRIEKRMLITQIESLEQYIAYALTNESEQQILRQSFLIGVTRFFRDSEAFTRIREHVIPDLFARTPEEQDLRIWVPSCSTGEEVYTIAMLVEDYLDSQSVRRSYKIFGSDVDRRSIVYAGQGRYDETIQADVPPEFLQQYFIRSSQGYRINDALKEHILFAVQNLLDDPPFIRVDLISCRNFLIYVNADAQQQILSNFHFGLNPAAYLFLGPSEHLGSLQATFTTVDRRWKIYQKRPDGAAPSPRTTVRAYSSLRTGKLTVPTMAPTHSASVNLEAVRPQSVHPNPPRVSMDEYSRFLSERYAPTTLFVNQRYDILYLNGEFTGILRLPRFDALLSLRTVINEDVQSLLIAGVDRVLSSHRSGLFERINVAADSEPPRWLQVRFSLFDSTSVNEPVVMLEFMNATNDKNGGSTDENGDTEVYDVDRRLLEKVGELEAELLRSERRAQKLYNELEATNEELQSSNRELLASNEEMQSTNEELQSVNEELYTVNNEYQRKNDELINTNNDINNLLKSTQISTVFVDNDLNIRRFTPGIGELFNLTNYDLGRPLAAFANPFDGVDIEQLAREVLRTKMRYDTEVQDRSGNYFLLRLIPYLTQDDQPQGAVITFVDTNDLVMTRRRLTDLAHKYEAIFQNTQEVIAIVENNSRIKEINRSLAGRSKQELLDTYFTDLVLDDPGKVQFTEMLRAAFDHRQVDVLALSLPSTGDEAARVEAEFIPILTTSTDPLTAKESTVTHTMIIIHDITSHENQRIEYDQVVQRYERLLSHVSQPAGLFDMNERIVFMNERTTLARKHTYYLQRSITDLLSPEGVNRFRRAVEQLKQGQKTIEVNYPDEELLEETQALRVRYRPVFADDEMVLISFEVLQTS